MIRRFFAAAILVTTFATVKTYAQEQTSNPQSKPKHEGFFQKLDTDKDGKISKAEADKSEKGKLKEKFSAIDANSDAFLTKEELKAYRQKNGHDQHGGARHGNPLQKIDTDKDGKISKAEADKLDKGHLKEKFSVIDANSDSYLTKEELMAYRKMNGHDQHRGPKHEGPFQKLDTDKDGKISKAEADKQENGRFNLKEKFSAVDANGDSYVDRDELLSYRKSQQEKRAAAQGK
jgi:Ca2+-binding EF-hand superfamily protein